MADSRDWLDQTSRVTRLYVPSLRRLTLDVRIEGYPDGPGQALRERRGASVPLLMALKALFARAAPDLDSAVERGLHRALRVQNTAGTS